MIPLILTKPANYPTNDWLKTNNFTGTPETFCLSPDGLYVGHEGDLDIWSLAHLPKAAPNNDYSFNDYSFDDSIDEALATKLLLGWELGRYQYGKDNIASTLTVPNADTKKVKVLTKAIYRARDLVNSPPNILTPETLAEQILDVAKAHNAETSLIEGDQLLDQNFPLVHAVGRASNNPPCLAEFRWGNTKHRHITLVGKGVTFDSGGLDKKSASNMKLMKKDMGGAAQTLALAECIMALNLPICLRVIIPCVENSISSNAFRVSDVIKSRAGLTVEIGNTDAEGRLILADGLAYASEENPDLIIDCATLTGAARVAVGTDIAALFTNDNNLVSDLYKAAENWQDPIWQLPLHKPYFKKLATSYADTNSTGGSGYAGATVAALFLEQFVGKDIPWLHLDFMAWRLAPLPGRPKGGDVMGMLALLDYLQ